MSTASDMYAAYLAAEQTLLSGKEHRLSIGGTDRLLRHEDLQWIIEGRKDWKRQLDAETAVATGRPSIGGLGFAVARMDY